MDGKRIWKNNRGAALILVIGCVALLSVLGALLMAKTLNNREMKELERKSQETFYKAESGSQELVTAIEATAQKALQSAFEDMLLQYKATQASGIGQDERLAQYYEEVLKTKLSSQEASDYLKDALEEELGTELTVTWDRAGITMDESKRVFNGEGVMVRTGVLTIPDVTFSYTGADGKTKITTDILVQANVPNLNGFASAAACEFTDFAILSGANVSTGELKTDQDFSVTGNLYAKGDLQSIHSGNDIIIINANKVLVGGNINLTGATLDIDNEEDKIGSGYGVWASGINLSDGAKVDAVSNFYVADDLTISGIGTQFIASGGAASESEYLGYSGLDGTIEAANANSAVIINKSSNITLDFSGLSKLILSGNSYIRDAAWSTGGVGITATQTGILQGESLAYKDLQALYLVPGVCLSAGTNPMPAGQSAALLNPVYEYEWDADGVVTGSINLYDYVNNEHPFETRTVRLEGGSSQFTYVYMNFQSEAKAAEYFKLYLTETPNGKMIQNQIKNLGNSKIVLAANNYLKSNAVTYDANVSNAELNIFSPSTTESAISALSCNLAKQRYNSLFTSLRLGSAAGIPAGYDLIKDGVINRSNVELLPAGTWTKTEYDHPTDSTKKCNFWVYNGDVTINAANPLGLFEGIVLVNGKLTFAAGGTQVTGLVIATDGVEVQQSVTLTADKDILEELLQYDDVAKYFRGYASAGGANYLSTEAVTITFENWLKN